MTSSWPSFNEDDVAMMRHFGMKPPTTTVGAKEENGDVEAANGALGRSLEHALLMRRSRDFESREVWQSFIDDVGRRANKARGRRVADDIAAMHERPPAGSRASPDRLPPHHWSLVRKPGAFARYVYRDELFPSVLFRRAYDAIQTPHHGIEGAIEYLRILHLAASTLEADVEAALSLLFAEEKAITADAVKALVEATTTIDRPRPALAVPPVDLTAYDALITAVGA